MLPRAGAPGALAGGTDLLVRLNADDSLDAAFRVSTNYNATSDADVHAVAVQPNDGKPLLAGSFRQVDGQKRGSLARLNPDGSLDAGFNADFDSRYQRVSVFALALQPGGKLLTGGYFGRTNGTVVRLPRLHPDGSPDAGFQADARLAFLSCLVRQPDGELLVGGSFSGSDASSPRPVARLNADGSRDPGFFALAGDVSDPTTVGAHGLALQPDGKIVLGGQFTRVNGQTRLHVARLLGDAAGPGRSPSFTGDAGARARVGQPFAFQIGATNAPFAFTASNSPPGLGLDATTGLISGTTTAVGSYGVTLGAANGADVDNGTLTIFVDPSRDQPAVIARPSAAASSSPGARTGWSSPCACCPEPTATAR